MGHVPRRRGVLSPRRAATCRKNFARDEIGLANRPRLADAVRMSVHELIREYKNGKSITSLADICGVSFSNVRKRLLRHGVQIRSAGCPKGHSVNGKLTIKKRNELIHALRTEDTKRSEIAQRFKVTRQYCSLICKMHGLSNRFVELNKARKLERKKNVEEFARKKKEARDEAWEKIISLLKSRADTDTIQAAIRSVTSARVESIADVSAILTRARKQGREIPRRHYHRRHYHRIRKPSHLKLKPDPRKIKARRILNYGVRWGYIKRLPCSVCGDLKSEGHHEDYDKPKEVIWLCMKHHREIHAKRLIVSAP